MNKKSIVTTIIACFFLLIVVLPQISYCQTSTPSSTPAKAGLLGNTSALLLIGGIIAVVVVVIVVVTFVFVFKKRKNEKSLNGGVSTSDFEDQVIKKFNGKPSDPSTGVSGFTEGGQPLLIKQSDPVRLADVEAFVKVLVNGKAQKGIIVAPDFDDTALEGRITAMDGGIELQMLRINELINKRYAA